MTPAPHIALIDYGAGNVPSVERALQKLGATSRRVTQSSDLTRASAIILPGVGHYAAIIRALDEHNLRFALLKSIACGTPFLGICLGLREAQDKIRRLRRRRGRGEDSVDVALPWWPWTVEASKPLA